MRLAGTIQTHSSRSIALHTAPRTSTPPRRRQHHELEGQRVHLTRLRRPHLLDGRPHPAVGQGLPVPDQMVLGAEHRQEPVARVVRSPSP